MTRPLEVEDGKKYKLGKISSPYIEDIRNKGVELCKVYKKNPLFPEDEDIKWFTEDLKVFIPEKEAAEDLKDNEKAKNWYKFPELQWFKMFYDYTLDPLMEGWDNTGLKDFVVFFSLAEPRLKIPYLPFHTTIYALHMIRRKEIIDQVIEKIINEDSEVLTRILKGDAAIPLDYTKLIPFPFLRTRILDRYYQKNSKAINSFYDELDSTQSPRWKTASIVVPLIDEKPEIEEE